MSSLLPSLRFGSLYIWELNFVSLFLACNETKNAINAINAINVWLPHFPSHVVPGHVLITWSEWPLACRSTERPRDETKRKESFILVQN